MGKETEGQQLSRRTFVKGSALAALTTAAGTGALGSLYGCSTAGPSGGSGGGAASEEKTVWSHCNVNCGGRCALQFHTQDGEIVYMESDNTGDSSVDGLQSRACLRGRSMRRWINSPDRLQYPMKRTGKRGDGQFEQISWDEAIDLIAEKLKYTIDTYGNEAVYTNYATGMYAVTGRMFDRFINLIGGQLGMYGDYSTAQITAAMPYTYGGADSFNASPLIEALNSDLLVMFGNSPADTRMGGANIVHDLELVRESGTKIINIDYRLN
jgi:anaerobic selenocysteine-containing dehydrogenase